MGKLVQSMVHGAKRRHGRRQLRRRPAPRARGRRNPARRWPWSIRSTRYRLEGQKTAAFEIIDDLGEAPDAHFLPVGNAGNISAYWKGYRRISRAGPLDAPAAHGRFPGGGGRADFPRARDRSSPRRSPAPSASATRRVGSWRRAAMRDSGGAVDIVTDEEILLAQRWLAANEGIFVEPASAAGVAGLLKWLGRAEPHAPLPLASCRRTASSSSPSPATA